MAEVVAQVEGLPANSVAQAVQGVGGVEQEFFVAGSASTIALVDGGDYPTDGRWRTERTQTQAPFKTRLIVERPADPAKFNGTVILVWNNVTVGENFEFPDRAARLVKDGFAIVGVSAQFVGVEGFEALMNRQALPEYLAVNVPKNTPYLKRDDARYGSLTHPGDDFCFDIFGQAGILVGPDRPRTLDPLGGLEVRRVIGSGASQSGVRLAAFVNGAHRLSPICDAYLLVVYPNAPSALTRATAPPGLPQLGGINPSGSLFGNQHRIRDDLGVPIIVLNSEYEAGECYPNFQPDTDLVRWWDVAGAGHLGAADPAQLAAILNMAVPHSTVSFGPLHRGAVHALHAWLTEGNPPPRQPRISRVGDRFERDSDGNAVGGIRMPDMEAPLAVHIGENLRRDVILHFGTSTPFAPEKVRALYPTKDAYLAKYRPAVDRLVEAKVIAPDEADALLAAGERFTPPA